MRYTTAIHTLLLLLIPITAYCRADEKLLKQYVMDMTSAPGHRNIKDTAALNNRAAYILKHWSKYTDHVWLQTYTLHDKSYYNVIASFGPADASRIIIGAHYDVCGDHPGADDNASGVAGIMELARLLSGKDTKNWKYRVDLVAYTLEEPPTFGDKDMGSAVHARSLHDSNIVVKGMVSVEMIGFYRDAKHTQAYPLGLLKLLYGSRANYITAVRKFGGGQFCRQFTRGFKKGRGVIARSFCGPAWVPGIDLSDHYNYWAYGWDAMMITDTSYLRNENYHKATDTPETLDYKRMAAVVDKLLSGILSIL